jgi:hypothetical protein
MKTAVKKLLEEYIEKKDGKAILGLIASENDGKFSAKLTFTQRCEVLALLRSRVTQEVIAELYGIDRRTVTHVGNPKSPHYKNVREEEKQMGTENFVTKYLDNELSVKAGIIKSKLEGEKSGNNKQSNKKAGLHMVRNQYCDYDHRVLIQWVELDVITPGWYYKDLDGDLPDKWLRAASRDPDYNPSKSSQACYDGMLQEIADKL